MLGSFSSAIFNDRIYNMSEGLLVRMRMFWGRMQMGDGIYMFMCSLWKEARGKR